MDCMCVAEIRRSVDVESSHCVSNGETNEPVADSLTKNEISLWSCNLLISSIVVTSRHIIIIRGAGFTPTGGTGTKFPCDIIVCLEPSLLYHSQYHITPHNKKQEQNCAISNISSSWTDNFLINITKV